MRIPKGRRKNLDSIYMKRLKIINIVLTTIIIGVLISYAYKGGLFAIFTDRSEFYYNLAVISDIFPDNGDTRSRLTNKSLEIDSDNWLALVSLRPLYKSWGENKEELVIRIRLIEDNKSRAKALSFLAFEALTLENLLIVEELLGEARLYDNSSTCITLAETLLKISKDENLSTQEKDLINEKSKDSCIAREIAYMNLISEQGLPIRLSSNPNIYRRLLNCLLNHMPC